MTLEEKNLLKKYGSGRMSKHKIMNEICNLLNHNKTYVFNITIFNLKIELVLLSHYLYKSILSIYLFHYCNYFPGRATEFIHS